MTIFVRLVYSYSMTIYDNPVSMLKEYPIVVFIVLKPRLLSWSNHTTRLSAPESIREH